MNRNIASLLLLLACGGLACSSTKEAIKDDPNWRIPMAASLEVSAQDESPQVTPVPWGSELLELEGMDEVQRRQLPGAVDDRTWTPELQFAEYTKSGRAFLPAGTVEEERAAPEPTASAPSGQTPDSAQAPTKLKQQPPTQGRAAVREKAPAEDVGKPEMDKDPQAKGSAPAASTMVGETDRDEQDRADDELDEADMEEVEPAPPPEPPKVKRKFIPLPASEIETSESAGGADDQNE